MPGYLFPHGSDFSEQTTISADSKIINSGRRRCRSRGRQRVDDISRGVERDRCHAGSFSFAVYGQRRRGRSTARFARGANEPGEKTRAANYRGENQTKCAPVMSGGGKIKSKARMDRGAKNRRRSLRVTARRPKISRKRVSSVFVDGRGEPPVREIRHAAEDFRINSLSRT